MTKALLSEVSAARRFAENTCPASRHVQMIGEALFKGTPYPMIHEEPQHCGESMLYVVKALYQARTRIAEMEGGK